MMPGLEGTSLGRYRLKERLGRGGMAEVYLAADERMRRDVALKIVRSSNTEFSQRFDREAQTMGKLRHDHILAAYDYGEQEPWHYLVMPYIEHGTLSDLLQKGPLSLEHAGELLQQVASGLMYAHQQGVLHRDIKPSNILLRDDHYAYLGDFGLAREQEGTNELTQTGVLLGTPEYMAPELAEGPATVSSDIYALAVVLYHMLSGRVPFRGETAISIFWKHVREQPLPPSQFNTKLPPAVDRVLMRALDKDPLKRFPTPLALSQAYQEAVIELEAMPDLYETEAIASPPVQTSPPVKSSVQPEARRVAPSQPAAPLQEPPRPRSPRRQLTPTVTSSSTQRQSFEQTTDVIVSGGDNVATRPQQPRRRRRRQNSRVLGGVIIGLVFLLVVSSILAFLTIKTHQQNNVAATATSKAGATSTLISSETQQVIATQQAISAIAATATAETQATQTVISATATAQAQANEANLSGTATAITGTTPLVRDPLSGQDSNSWADDGVACQFTNGVYSASVKGSNTFQSCISNHLQYGDAAIQVNITLITGDSAGIVFRSSEDAGQFYDFEVTGDGHFFLRFRNNGRYTMIIPATASSSSIHSKGNSNTLLVIAKGSDFKLFVNGDFVAETHDGTFANGLLGLAVGTNSSSSGEASFDNLNIYQA